MSAINLQLHFFFLSQMHQLLKIIMIKEGAWTFPNVFFLRLLICFLDVLA